MPKDVMEDQHKEKIEAYITAILNHKEMRNVPDLKQLFKLQHFFEEAEAQDKIFDPIQIPD